MKKKTFGEGKGENPRTWEGGKEKRRGKKTTKKCLKPRLTRDNNLTSAARHKSASVFGADSSVLRGGEEIKKKWASQTHPDESTGRGESQTREVRKKRRRTVKRVAPRERKRKVVDGAVQRESSDVFIRRETSWGPSAHQRGCADQKSKD